MVVVVVMLADQSLSDISFYSSALRLAVLINEALLEMVEASHPHYQKVVLSF